MDKLKPCPFCGAIPVRKEETSNRSGITYHWVSCENENCLVQPVTPAYTCKGADVRAWNRRCCDD